MLAIEPEAGVDAAGFEATVRRVLSSVQARYRGIDIERAAAGKQVLVPASYHGVTKRISAGSPNRSSGM